MLGLVSEYYFLNMYTYLRYLIDTLDLLNSLMITVGIWPVGLPGA